MQCNIFKMHCLSNILYICLNEQSSMIINLTENRIYLHHKYCMNHVSDSEFARRVFLVYCVSCRYGHEPWSGVSFSAPNFGLSSKSAAFILLSPFFI